MSGAPIVAFVGRTTSPEKNFPRFTRIARRLQAAGAKIWIADPHEGWTRKDGDTAEPIEAERWSRVPHAEMPDFYRAIAASGGVLLITSISEGFGNVAPEAAACGARVAAPDVLGLREAIVDGVTGLLFPADAGYEDVAARLQAWLGEPHDEAACAEAAKREFSPEAMVSDYLTVYGRNEPSLSLTPSPSPADTPELRHLLAHLDRQGGWRAEFARDAAVELANNGYPREALHALRMAVRAAPRQVLSRAGARQVAAVGRGVIFRRSPQP
jgi:hypothetical protein